MSQTDQMRAMLDQGQSLEAIGRAFNITRHTVTYHLSKSGAAKSRFSTNRWTDAEVQRLTKLFNDGLSAGAIGQEMGVTRNTVIGKLSRLGLRRTSPVARRERKPRDPQPEKSPIKTFKRSNIPLPEIAAADVTPLDLPFEELTFGACRYPYGDGPFTFCCHPVLPGRPYCGPHHVLCNTRPVGEQRGQTEIRKREFARNLRVMG